MHSVVTSKEIVTNGYYVMERACGREEYDHKRQANDYFLMVLLDGCRHGVHDAHPGNWQVIATMSLRHEAAMK
jgi:hypothetical protein